MNAIVRSLVFTSLSASALALAGCDSKDDTVVAKNASVEDVAKQVSKADLRPRPGRWNSKVQITSMDIPGLPPQAREMMKGQLAKVTEAVSCLTPEQADAANGEFFKPKNNEACKYNTFKMGGGKIEADMTCSSQGASQNMKMSGTYSSDAYAMQMTSQGTIEDKPVSMAMKVDAARVGECDGTEPS